MVDKDSTWETFEDPRVLQGIKGCDALLWVPVETLDDKVEESFAPVADNFCERSRAR